VQAMPASTSRTAAASPAQPPPTTATVFTSLDAFGYSLP
jgi:hypothetical protein